MKLGGEVQIVKQSLAGGRSGVSQHLKELEFRLKHKRLEKRSVEDIKTYVLLKKAETNSISNSPKYNNQCHYECSYQPVDIKLYELSDVYCNIECSSFVSGDIKSVYIEEFPYISCQDANYKSGFLVRHDTKSAYIKNIRKNSVRAFKRALFLGGNGSFNFYHWMIEIAPKLLVLTDEALTQRAVNTIIVSECVQKNDNYQWVLQQCLKHLHDIEIVYAQPKEVLFVEHLYFVNTFNQTIYNYHNFLDDYRTSTIFNKEVVIDLRHRLSNATLHSPKQRLDSNSHKKIFILRNEDAVSSYNKRSYNQDEVFSFFKKEGFVGVYPDKLSLIEQITMFQEASFIVGPSGAAWSNLLFAQEGTKAISWLPEQLKYFDTYCSLANILGVDMHYLQYQVKCGKVHGSYRLDLQQLIDLYQQIQ
ncbi:glycosyltransferase family 61 protein [Psychrobacter sp. H7-1]|uniref:glycosyltransferase family 61 protein n=1 Tax=Psychrobacter sp. H7-1 TaxID=1569265 RepID=UPI00191AE31C|nr:glycosyltransferase family 61 protein [Psychrobacter sp. H7-1]